MKKIQGLLETNLTFNGLNVLLKSCNGTIGVGCAVTQFEWIFVFVLCWPRMWWDLVSMHHIALRFIHLQSCAHIAFRRHFVHDFELRLYRRISLSQVEECLFGANNFIAPLLCLGSPLAW